MLSSEGRRTRNREELCRQKRHGATTMMIDTKNEMRPMVRVFIAYSAPTEMPAESVRQETFARLQKGTRDAILRYRRVLLQNA